MVTFAPLPRYSKSECAKKRFDEKVEILEISLRKKLLDTRNEMVALQLKYKNIQFQLFKIWGQRYKLIFFQSFIAFSLLKPISDLANYL